MPLSKEFKNHIFYGEVPLILTNLAGEFKQTRTKAATRVPFQEAYTGAVSMTSTRLRWSLSFEKRNGSSYDLHVIRKKDHIKVRDSDGKEINVKGTSGQDHLKVLKDKTTELYLSGIQP